MGAASAFSINDYWPGHSHWRAEHYGSSNDRRKSSNGRSNGHDFAAENFEEALQSWPQPPMKVRRAADFHGMQVPERRFLVPNLIPAGNVTALYGDGGTGKSQIAEQLAVASSAGRKWLGQHVNGGTTLFLTAEDDIDEVHRRLSEIAISEGIGLNELTDLHIVSLAGEDALLALPDGRGGELVPTPRFAELTELIADLMPALVVLDTLADLFGGEENNRSQARQFIAMLRGISLKQKTTILLLAHPSLTGMSTGTGSSGSTGWNNSVRSRLYFERPKNDSGEIIDPDLRVLRLKKANYAGTDFELKVRWRNGVFVPDEVQSSDRFTRAVAQSRSDETFLKLLIAYGVEGRRVSASVGGNYAPTLFSRDVRAEGISLTGFRDAMTRLLAGGRIRMESSGPPSRPVHRLVLAEPQP